MTYKMKLRTPEDVREKLEYIINSKDEPEISQEVLVITNYIIDELEKKRIQISSLYANGSEIDMVISFDEIYFCLYINSHGFNIEEHGNPKSIMNGKSGKLAIPEVDFFILGPITERDMLTKMNDVNNPINVPTDDNSSYTIENDQGTLYKFPVLDLSNCKPDPLPEDHLMRTIISELTEINKVLFQDIYQVSLSGMELQLVDIKMELKETNRLLALLCQKP